MATAKPPEKTAAQEFDEIHKKADALKAREKELLAAQIELESQGVRPELPIAGHSVRDLAAAMLDGSALPATREPPPGEVLHDVINERAAILIALDALADQENSARRIAVAEAIRETADEWRGLVRRRAMAAIELRQANQAAAEFRERIRRIGKSPPSLVCDVTNGSVFGPAIIGDPTYLFLENCISAKIITRNEAQ